MRFSTFLLTAVLSSLASCAERNPPYDLPLHHHFPESAPQDPAQDEVRAVLAAYDDAVASCRAATGDCTPMLLPVDPCAPPRRPPAASFTGLRPEALGAFYFDGTHCYEATEAQPGPCATGHACQPWTTQRACESAITACAAKRIP